MNPRPAVGSSDVLGVMATFDQVERSVMALCLLLATHWSKELQSLYDSELLVYESHLKRRNQNRQPLGLTSESRLPASLSWLAASCTSATKRLSRIARRLVVGMALSYKRALMPNDQNSAAREEKP